MGDTLAAGGLTFSPLYKEVKNRLTRGLAAGDWKPGKAIPSEAKLAERFNVSIGTIRKAIDELVAERILLRQQGRGTFVATHTEDRTLFYFFHIVGKDGSREPPTLELLSFRRAKATAIEEEKLGLERGAAVFRIQNLLHLGGEPVIFDEITVPQALFPDLSEDVFAQREGTIYGLYQARYGISVLRISERLAADRAPARAAALLGIPADSPALAIKRVAFTYDDTPVEYRVSWVDTEKHEYLSDLWKNDGLR
ncbi:MAG TPA: GntR family transcriptional regulator [Burkholderiales bacterium]|nr:GntR family transcriptional regulator [Burkholderiales bacterium]